MKNKIDMTIYTGSAEKSAQVLVLNPENYVDLGISAEREAIRDTVCRAIYEARKIYPRAVLSRAAVVLPDSYFACDTVTMPTADAKRANQALGFELRRTYSDRNKDEIHTALIARDGAESIFSITALHSGIASEIREAATRLGVDVTCITSESQAVVCFALSKTPSQRRGAFSILSIGEQSSRLIFVKDSAVIGTYSYFVGKAATDEAQRVAGYVLGENKWLSQIGDFSKIYVIGGEENNAELRGATALELYKKELSF